MRGKLIDFLWSIGYDATILCLLPINLMLVPVFRRRYDPHSVLHISYMIHVPYHTVQILRQQGVKADFLAIGANNMWDRADYHLTNMRWPFVSALRDMIFFWRVMARYEVIHSHFMISLSPTFWDFRLLKRLGRRLIIHFRGCEARDRERNMALNPSMNICQECDYRPRICETRASIHKRALVRRIADAILVTTPDLLDFWPDATILSFFVPPDLEMHDPSAKTNNDNTVTIVHATNHPGIEGTASVERTIESLQKEGYPLRWIFLKGATHDAVLEAFAHADLSIGKMKMGTYANAQVESMALGTPAITHVREEFMSQELRESGFVLTNLDELKDTLRRLLEDPTLLAEKTEKARSSILRLHDNDKLADRLFEIYGWRAVET